jgi:flagellar biosynthetic protein FlhB
MAEGAEDRTEAATPRRLQRARDEGQFPLSPEVGSAAVLASAALVLSMMAPGRVRGVVHLLTGLLEDSDAINPAAAAHSVAVAVATVAAPFAVAAMAAAIAATFGQTGFSVRLGAFKPGFGRLNVRRNASRLVGKQVLLELGKSLLKLSLVAAAVWQALAPLQSRLAEALLWEPGTQLQFMVHLLLRLLLAGLAAQSVVAGFDVIRARWSHGRSMRMSREEVKDEMREMEGDPRIKARIRRIRVARARRRMLEAVRKATVVVTNPTHYAVALAYERGGGGAPRVVAKGLDAMATRIREVADSARVPLVSNPPLARALWRVELDSEIPAALFQAVAEIIAYVWRLRMPVRRQ